jgi:hypothetical protein
MMEPHAKAFMLAWGQTISRSKIRSAALEARLAEAGAYSPSDSTLTSSSLVAISTRQAASSWQRTVELEQRVEELELLLEEAQRQLEDEGAGGRLLADRDAELEAARADAKGLAEVVELQDEALRQLAAAAEGGGAAARAALHAAEAAAARPRGRLDHHVWSLGAELAVEGAAAQEGAPPPPASGQAAPGPEDGLADWLVQGGTSRGRQSHSDAASCMGNP